LTAALAKRCDRAVGVDVAPTMVEHARRNVPQAEFRESLPDEEFDFIVSLIVFQHIPVAEGMCLLRELLSRLRPGGRAALQFTITRRGGALRRMARGLRANVPLVHTIASRLEGDTRNLPYMRMNGYDLDAIRVELSRAGCEEVSIEGTDHGGIEGVLIVARKSLGIHEL
jgi:trans-aconitate methyltransferase